MSATLVMPLATSGDRAKATAALNAATEENDILTAATLVDVLDAVCSGVLRPTGIDDEDARAVLSTMWASRG